MMMKMIQFLWDIFKWSISIVALLNSFFFVQFQFFFLTTVASKFWAIVSFFEFKPNVLLQLPQHGFYHLFMCIDLQTQSNINWILNIRNTNVISLISFHRNYELRVSVCYFVLVRLLLSWIEFKIHKDTSDFDHLDLTNKYT